jgi:CheY-like chemotaxis protein
MPEYMGLVIEDDIDLSQLFAQALRSAGLGVEIINHGSVARERLKHVLPDLILLDLHLPGVDGRQLLEQITTDPYLMHTKVILTTADYQFAEMLRDQVFMVLLKPIGYVQLRDLVKHIFKS